MNRVRALLQAVGFLTLGLLAIYGALAIAGGAGPLTGALSARAQEALPVPAVTAQEVMTGTLVAAPDAANAASGPATINYQGFARENGALVNGPRKVTARIWDLAAGGTELYKTTAENVPFVDGQFNILLGVTEPEKLAAVLSVSPRYIGIDLGSGELIPRQKVHTVPWAMNATNAGTATTLVLGATFTAGDIWANKYSGETVNVNREVRMPRTYQMFQMYKGWGSDAGKDLGTWDLCVLAGHQVLGADDNGGTCFVQMAGWQTGFNDFGPLTVGQNERQGWVLYGGGARYAAVRCEAVCMNFGR